MDIWARSDLCTPWCLRVAVTLRIAEHIDGGVTTIDALAASAGADANSLLRVLRHLVGQGIFDEPVPGRFALNDPARALMQPALRLNLDLDGFGGRMTHAWESLLAAVRSGAPGYHEVFGRPFWSDLEANPDIAASFDALMGPDGHGPPDPEVLVTGDWVSIRTIVDVGGGNGSLLAAILRARPHVRGILVDRTQTVARSSEVFRTAGVMDRATAVGQSFFDPLPAGADLYLLKSVLADWPDAEATAILARCAEAARPGGRVLILNGVWPDEETAPAQDVLMMVLVGGKERTLSEFRPLARQAGLEIHTAVRQPGGRFVVECRPADPLTAEKPGPTC